MRDYNLSSYNSSGVLSWYSMLKTFIPVEEKVFEIHRDLLSNADVLDIGFGGGRTSDFLIKRCKSYTGIDYSAGFVKIVQEKYPAQPIYEMDARNLSFFADHTFDFVNFSFNGIDYVDYAGREKILQEINRVLRPGGIFFFSTHNKCHPGFSKNPWSDGSQPFTTNLKTFVKLFPFFARHLMNKKKEIYKNEYAIINDCAHNYSLFTFYTDPAFLKKQLQSHGFQEQIFFSKEGLEKPMERLDDWIFVTCKKSAA